MLRISNNLTLPDYLNDELVKRSPEYVIFPMGQLRHTLIDDNHQHLFGDNVYMQTWIAVVADAPSGDEVKQRLKELGVTHVYYIDGDIDVWRSGWCVDGLESTHCEAFLHLVDRRFSEFANTLRTVTSTDEWTVYAL